jgi:hypothetical protein
MASSQTMEVHGQTLYRDGAGQSPVVSKKRPTSGDIPYQRTNSLTGRTRAPLGSG